MQASRFVIRSSRALASASTLPRSAQPVGNTFLSTGFNVKQMFSYSSTTAVCDPKYTDGIHRSNAQEKISHVPVIEVDGHVAVCDGGSGALGHPVEYIQLDTVSNEPQICKYCGLRYKMKPH